MLVAPRPRQKSRRQNAGGWPDGQHFVFEGVSWPFYEQMLREFGNQQIRLTYDEGRLEVMSPLPEHERPKELLSLFIRLIAIDRRMLIASFGSTTFRLKSKQQGLEPDVCYYVQNEAKVRRRRRIELHRDPPPDLVVEVDITNPSIPREPIYAAMGVPEIWRYDGQRVQCLHLVSGVYRIRRSSLAFPFLEPADLTRFVKMIRRKDEASIAIAFMAEARKRGWMPSTPA